MLSKKWTPPVSAGFYFFYGVLRERSPSTMARLVSRVDTEVDRALETIKPQMHCHYEER